jgi:hypothetical protein
VPRPSFRKRTSEEAFTQALALTAGISSAVVAAVLLRNAVGTSRVEAEQEPMVVEYKAPIELRRAA